MTPCTKCGTTAGMTRDYVGIEVLCGTCGGYPDPSIPPRRHFGLCVCADCEAERREHERAAGELAMVTSTGIVDAEWNEQITADDVRTARLDTDAHGSVFPEIKLAAALQVLREAERQIRDRVVHADDCADMIAAAIERIK